jgi:bacillithiol system protein YtxJ
MAAQIIALTSEEDINRIAAISHERPVFLYKHSTACSISARSYRVYHAYAEAAGPDAAPLFTEVYVIEHRPVSTAVAHRFGVMHQSPQLLLISNGRAVWDVSHFDITEEAMDGALAGQRG